MDYEEDNDNDNNEERLINPQTVDELRERLDDIAGYHRLAYLIQGNTVHFVAVVGDKELQVLSSFTNEAEPV